MKRMTDEQVGRIMKSFSAAPSDRPCELCRVVARDHHQIEDKFYCNECFLSLLGK